MKNPLSDIYTLIMHQVAIVNYIVRVMHDYNLI